MQCNIPLCDRNNGYKVSYAKCAAALVNQLVQFKYAYWDIVDEPMPPYRVGLKFRTEALQPFFVQAFCSTFFSSILFNWMEESEVSASTVIHIREMSVSHGAKV